MANKSVLELAVGTGQWDAGLKKAKSALDNFVSAQGGLKAALDKDSESVTKFVQMLGNIDSTAKTTKGQMRELTQATADLTVAYRSLTDEERNSPFGQALADSIAKMTEKAGIMRDAMDDVNLSIKNAASDTRRFDQMVGAVTFATSAFQSLQGAGKLLGIEMGNNVEVIAKLQAAMAITNGLTQMQTLLQKESAFMQGVTAAKAAISATAHGILAGQITAAAIAQRALNLAMRAAPWAIAATAIYAVVTAISKSSEKTDEETAKRNAATEAMKRERAERERLAQKAKDQADKVSNATGDMIAKYRVLQEEWNTLKTNQEKNDFIKDNTSAFNAFGTSIRNAADAQRFFVEQADKVIEVLKTMAEAEAFKDLLTDAIKKKYTTDPTKVDYKEYALSTNEISAYSPSRHFSYRDGAYKKYSDADNQKYLQDFINSHPELKNAGITTNDYWSESTSQDIKFHIKASAIGKVQDVRKSNIIKNATDELDSDVENLTEKYSNSIKKVQELQADMPLFNGGKGNGNGNNSKTQTEEQENSAMITKLVEEYQKLATAEKTADDVQKESISARKTAIQGEIKKLQERNAELKKFADEAKGIKEKVKEPEKVLSGFNAENIADWTKKLQDQLKKTDFGTPIYQSITENLKDMSSLTDIVKQAMKAGVEFDQNEVNDIFKKIFDGGNIDDNVFEGMIDKINEALEKKGIKLKFDADTGNVTESKTEQNTEQNSGKKNPYITKNADGTKTVNLSKTMDGMASGITQMTSGIRDLGIKIPSGFDKVTKGIGDVTSVLNGITTIVYAIQAVVSVIEGASVLDAIIPFARGGIVPHAANGYFVSGTHYSGDVTPIMANAGELVLNKSQQFALANQLQDIDRGGIESHPYVTGEAIYLGLQNYTRRKGMGEMVTSRRR